jgi:hypothetical protein
MGWGWQRYDWDSTSLFVKENKMQLYNAPSKSTAANFESISASSTLPDLGAARLRLGLGAIVGRM